MKITKYIGALLGIDILVFLFIVNFSSVNTNYECKGAIESEESNQPLTVYIAVEEYRWWVGLWSESDGNIQLESANQSINYYDHLDKTGNNLFIYEYPKEMKGSFSTLSKILTLNTPYGYFDGKCKVIQ